MTTFQFPHLNQRKFSALLSSTLLCHFLPQSIGIFIRRIVSKAGDRFGRRYLDHLLLPPLGVRSVSILPNTRDPPEEERTESGDQMYVLERRKEMVLVVMFFSCRCLQWRNGRRVEWLILGGREATKSMEIFSSFY